MGKHRAASTRPRGAGLCGWRQQASIPCLGQRDLLARGQCRGGPLSTKFEFLAHPTASLFAKRLRVPLPWTLPCPGRGVSPHSFRCTLLFISHRSLAAGGCVTHPRPPVCPNQLRPSSQAPASTVHVLLPFEVGLVTGSSHSGASGLQLGSPPEPSHVPRETQRFRIQATPHSSPGQEEPAPVDTTASPRVVSEQAPGGRGHR